jgi:hypothetical protein
LRESKHEFVLFLTDDSVFYRPVDLGAERLDIVRDRPEQRSISLRLGANVGGAPFAATSTREHLFHWSYYDSDATGDWGYPFSVDGVIYFRKTIQALGEKLLYANPNSFEGFLVKEVRRRGLLGDGYSLMHSALVGFALNRVQDVALNQSLDIPTSDLNSAFLAGYRIRYVLRTTPRVFHSLPDEVLLVHHQTGDEVSALTSRAHAADGSGRGAA